MVEEALCVERTGEVRDLIIGEPLEDFDGLPTADGSVEEEMLEVECTKEVPGPHIGEAVELPIECSRTAEGGMSRKMVIQEGELTESQRSLGSVFVIAEGHPSWLLLLEGAKFDDCHCYSNNTDQWFLKHCSNRANHVSSMAKLISSVNGCSNGNGRCILVQASTKSFAKKVRMKLEAKINLSPKDKVVVVSKHWPCMRSKSGGDWKGLELSHSNVGGVTSGVYKVHGLGFDPEVLASLKEPQLVNRFISGIAKADVFGVACSASESALIVDGSQGPAVVRSGDVHVDPHDLVGLFKLESVFSETKWVSRHLEASEIAAACDMPPALVKEFASQVGEGSESKESLLDQPPLKVLQSAFNLVSSGFTLRAPRKPIFSGPVDLQLSTLIPLESLTSLQSEHTRAVRSDDAATETLMWDLAVDPDYTPATHDKIYTFLRHCSRRIFASHAEESFTTYLEETYSASDLMDSNTANEELLKDREAGEDAILRVKRASFWEWTDGSTPFFWRWQPEVQKDMRDGSKIWKKGDLPSFRQKQSLPKDKSVLAKIREKIQKVRDRRYILGGMVRSLTSFFHVSKGEDDIRLVYDLTACGLNEMLWAPSFWMPNIGNVLDCATSSSWFSDVDAGEMFLNYLLDAELRPYAGVDMSWLFPGKTGIVWERWTRMAMGMRPSPFVTVRLFAWAMEIIKGDRMDPTNPFHWTQVVVNCPGTPEYNPSLPRLYKWNPIALAIACDCKTFVDDLRGIGPTKELLQRATHKVESTMGYLGLQDATRKRRPNSQQPGEWTGSISVALPDTGLFVTVSQKKWDRSRQIISDLLSVYSECKDDLPDFNLKKLEQKVGFLVHLGMAYPLMVPFLRGLYLTMNNWRSGRENSGWKLSRGARLALMTAMRGSKEWMGEPANYSDAPVVVKAVPLLRFHLEALAELFKSAEPSLRLIRGHALFEAMYVFGDASGEGFGSSWLGSDGSISFRFGVWGAEGIGTSSNYREFRNLVETLEGMGDDLKGKEVFLFTDNSVSEAVSFKGSSSSEALFHLVVRLYKLEMTHMCKIELVHVAGTRMIQQGTDGLSRGDMYEGVMKGESMFSFIPLHLNAFARSDTLEEWISSWAGRCREEEVETLSLEGWFERGHDVLGSRHIDGGKTWIPKYKAGTFIWAPPPGVARFAIEELRQARLKRFASFHIFVVPRLMGPEWKRHIHKCADCLFEVPAGHPCWPSEMHEPLTVALLFPYLSRCPWELRKTKLMVDMGRTVSSVLKTDPALGGHLLSELCVLAGSLDAMSVCELRRALCGRGSARFSSL